MAARLIFYAVWTIAALSMPLPLLGQEPSDSGDREIKQVRNNLYSVRDGRQYTVFLVTQEGIVLADPLSRRTALWLKDELASRFPGRPVRYVIYTHHHFDRAEGGAVFDQAQRIGHRDFNSELSKARQTLPALLVRADRDGNGVLDRDEMTDAPDPALIASKDRDGNGTVTPEELYRGVSDVRVTYTATKTVTLEGGTVMVVHPGPAHSPDMSVVYFPNERVVFAVDPPPVTARPFAFGSFRPRDVLEWLHTIAALEFDEIFLGNGETIARTDVVTLTRYLDALKSAVGTGYIQGQSLIEVQASSIPQGEENSPHYQGRLEQIADIYRSLHLIRAEVSGVAIGDYIARDASYCAAYVRCVAGGAIPAGTAAVSVLVGRHLGVVTELTFGSQLWSTRTRPLYFEEVALRQAQGSLLIRYTPSPGSAPLSVTLLGGPSIVKTDAVGMDLVQGVLVPTGGRHVIRENSSVLGVTFGTDLRLALGSRLHLIVPIRATRPTSAPLEYWPGRFIVNGGVGVAVRVLQHLD